MPRTLVYLALLLALGSCRDVQAPDVPVDPGLRVRAVGAEGSPLPYVLVTAMDEATATPVNALYDFRLDLDEAGRGSLDPLPEGRYSIRLHTLREFREEEGFDLVAATPVDVGGDRAADIDAILAPGGRMRVTLVDASGKGVPARIAVSNADGRAVATTLWRGEHGGWTTEFMRLSPPGFVSCVLPPGHYRVEAIRYREVIATGKIEITAGEVSEVPLTTK